MLYTDKQKNAMKSLQHVLGQPGASSKWNMPNIVPKEAYLGHPYQVLKPPELTPRSRKVAVLLQGYPEQPSPSLYLRESAQLPCEEISFPTLVPMI